MKVAVVTPYYRPERNALLQCYRSVKAQLHPCTQIFVADGDPLEIVDKFDAFSYQVPRPSWGRREHGTRDRINHRDTAKIRRHLLLGRR